MSIHPSVEIHPTATINCKNITIGAGSKIGKNCKIEGSYVLIGREFWMDEGAIIGGGSCFSKQACLEAGDFLHMGRDSMINIARSVTIGDEVGLGIRTQLNTHGAYLNELDGFPVQFEGIVVGSNVWLPNAWVNPGVTIGDNVVVGAGSLVNRHIPSGSLAAGSPAKIIKENYYPKELTEEQKIDILKNILLECKIDGYHAKLVNHLIIIGDTVINCRAKIIEGPVTVTTQNILNQLRRHGIRFRYEAVDGEYAPWSKE